MTEKVPDFLLYYQWKSCYFEDTVLLMSVLADCYVRVPVGTPWGNTEAAAVLCFQPACFPWMRSGSRDCRMECQHYTVHVAWDDGEDPLSTSPRWRLNLCS